MLISWLKQERYLNQGDKEWMKEFARKGTHLSTVPTQTARSMLREAKTRRKKVSEQLYLVKSCGFTPWDATSMIRRFLDEFHYGSFSWKPRHKSRRLSLGKQHFSYNWNHVLWLDETKMVLSSSSCSAKQRRHHIYGETHWRLFDGLGLFLLPVAKGLLLRALVNQFHSAPQRFSGNICPCMREGLNRAMVESSNDPKCTSTPTEKSENQASSTALSFSRLEPDCKSLVSVEEDSSRENLNELEMSCMEARCEILPQVFSNMLKHYRNRLSAGVLASATFLHKTEEHLCH